MLRLIFTRMRALRQDFYSIIDEIIPANLQNLTPPAAQDLSHAQLDAPDSGRNHDDALANPSGRG